MGSRAGSYLCTPQTKWINIGSIDTAASDFGATGRDWATVEATDDVLFLKPDFWPYACLLRFRSDSSENDTNVIQIYGAHGKDHYNKAAQITITQGQQIDSGTIYFADTLTPASEDALFDGEESNIANGIAHYYMRFVGVDRLAFLVSTLNSTTVYIDWLPLYE